MKFHRDGTLPSYSACFVFGSNLSGIHGAGAARVANQQFGAEWGKGVGFMQKGDVCCYAIPTKNEVIDTMTLVHIEPYIKSFVAYTHLRSDLEFFVTGVGCGLAGYKHKDIAPLFKGCGNNCSFPNEWKEYL